MPEDICENTFSDSCEGMKQMICWSMALLHLLQTETEQLRIRCGFSSEFVSLPSVQFKLLWSHSSSSSNSSSSSI